jgi:two-component system sensor histidine kinase RegB
MLYIALPLGPIAAILAIEAATNAACTLWARAQLPVGDGTLAAVMACDVVLLTALLSLSGGAFNPFSFLYLVHIALAAVVLQPRLTWALMALSLAGFGSLFLLPAAPTPSDAAVGTHVDHLRMHLEGMWLAFGVAAAFIVYFVQRVRRALAERESELAVTRNLTVRHEQFASLATLAAGAAHELATPLSTIAVVAKELERQLEGGDIGDAAADVRLIRRQVTRCRDILQQMAADAGEGSGESIVEVGVEDLVRGALDGALAADRIDPRVSDSARGRRLYIPPRAVAQALRGVLKNAVQASQPHQRVELRVSCDTDSWHFAVHDQGMGMPADVLRHAGEPFFTTKPPGHGMGLGLFLTRAVLSRLGGRFDLDSTPGSGTTAVLVLPAAAPAPPRTTAGAVLRTGL